MLHNAMHERLQLVLVCCYYHTLSDCFDSIGCSFQWTVSSTGMRLARPCACLTPAPYGPVQDIWAEDGPWAHESAPGDATGAAPGPSTGGQLRQEFAWMGETLSDPWAYHSSTCPLTHEAQALELFNRALARAMAACEADKPAAMAHAMLFAGCSRLAAEAMESGATAGQLPPQGLENVSIGLRLAEPIMVGLAQSHVAPRMAVEVLALWVRKAAGGGPAGAKSVFSEQPALESELYSADMRAGLRAALPMARSVFRRAMASMRDYMRAEPGDVVLEDRKALRACLRAERRADDAADERHPRPEHATAAAVREAKSQFEAAASLVPAALAARGGGAMAAPPQPGNSYLMSASRTMSVAHMMIIIVVVSAGTRKRGRVLPVSTQAQEPDKEWRVVAASSDDVSEGSFGGAPHEGEGAELDGMESDKSDHSLSGLEEEDARMHDDGPLSMKTTRGRNMCACLPCCFFCSWALPT